MHAAAAAADNVCRTHGLAHFSSSHPCAPLVMGLKVSHMASGRRFCCLPREVNRICNCGVIFGMAISR